MKKDFLIFILILLIVFTFFVCGDIIIKLIFFTHIRQNFIDNDFCTFFLIELKKICDNLPFIVK